MTWLSPLAWSDRLLADDAVYAVATAEKLPPVLTDFLRRHQ